MINEVVIDVECTAGGGEYSPHHLTKTKTNTQTTNNKQNYPEPVGLEN